MHLAELLLATFSSPGPILFGYGPFELRWYGFLIAISVIIGLNLSTILAQSRNIEKELINDLLPWLIFSSLIGARIYYVFFEWQNYEKNPIEVIAIWKGGIAIHGALIGGVLAILIFCRLRKQSFWDLLDMLVPSFALGQSIGRWGNFFNNEAFGLPTELPWKLFIPYQYRPVEFLNFENFHPTFLYESLWNFLIFITLIILIKRNYNNQIKLPSGSLSCIYLAGYSLARIFIESLRTDPLCIGALPPLCQGGLRVAQLISFLLIILSTFGLWWIFNRKKKLPSLGTNQRTKHE